MLEHRRHAFYDLLRAVIPTGTGEPPCDDELQQPTSILELLTRETSATMAALAVDFPGAGGLVRSTDDVIPHRLALNLARRSEHRAGEVICGSELVRYASQEELANLNLWNGALLPFVIQDQYWGALWLSGNDQLEEAELECARQARDALAVWALILALQDHRQRHETTMLNMLNTLDIAIHITDIQSYEILYANRQLLNTWGFQEDIRGLHCWRILQRQHEPCRFCPIPRLRINPGAPQVWERRNPVTGRVYRHSGHLFQWVDGRAAYLQQSVDVTRYRQTAVSLEKALDRAERASRIKSEVLAQTGEQLLASVNEMMGMVQIAADSRDEATIGSCLDEITISCKEMVGIISDAADLSRDQGDPSGPREFSVSATLSRLLEHLAELWRGKKQRLQVYIAEGTPSVFFGREDQLTKVLANLLSNAVKFTPEGRCIHLDVSAYPDSIEDRCYLQIQVIDTGIGIAPEFLPSLFDALSQRDSPRRHRHGLGLAVSRQVMSEHGGRILASSHEGFGSTFTVAMPMTVAGEESPATLLTYPDLPLPAPGQLRGRGVLIAGDPGGHPGALGRELDASGLDLAVSGTAEGALELIARDPGRFQLVLLDRYLPDMEGYEVVRRIGELCRSLEAPPPVLEMIAEPVTDGVQGRLKLGFRGQIPKPVTLGRLSIYLFRYLIPDLTAFAARSHTKETVDMTSEFSLPEDLKDYVDVGGALERLRGNQKVYKALLNTFLKNDTCDQLQGQAAGGDAAGAAISAHTIKGMAGNLSLTALYENAALLESQLKSGVATGESVQEFQRVWNKTCEYVSLVLNAMENGAI